MLAVLKKLKGNELAIFQDALKHYANVLQYVVENQQQINKESTGYNTGVDSLLSGYRKIGLQHHKYNFYIANDLWREINKKLDRSPQPLHTKLKLSYYKASVLKNALQGYQVELPTTSEDRAIIERLKQPLLQQT